MPDQAAAARPGLEPAPYRLPLEEELVARVAWLIRWRWVAAGALIGVTLGARYVLALRIPWLPLCLIGAAILAYNLLFLRRLRILRRNHTASVTTFSQFAAVQIALDWLALTLTVH